MDSSSVVIPNPNRLEPHNGFGFRLKEGLRPESLLRKSRGEFDWSSEP